MMQNMTIPELQRQGLSGVREAVYQLGLRALEIHFCFGDDQYCQHRTELAQLENDLHNEIPPECENCGHSVGDN